MSGDRDVDFAASAEQRARRYRRDGYGASSRSENSKRVTAAPTANTISHTDIDRVMAYLSVAPHGERRARQRVDRQATPPRAPGGIIGRIDRRSKKNPRLRSGGKGLRKLLGMGDLSSRSH